MEKEKRDKYLRIGIASFVLILLLIILASNFFKNKDTIFCDFQETYSDGFCCTDKNYNQICDYTEKSSFNANNILVSIEEKSEINFELSSQNMIKTFFVEVINNNAQRVCFRIYCESSIGAYSGSCWPIYDSSGYNLCVDGNSRGNEKIFISSPTSKGIYYADIKVDLFNYINEISGDFDYSYSTIKAQSFTINVN